MVGSTGYSDAQFVRLSLQDRVNRALPKHDH